MIKVFISVLCLFGWSSQVVASEKWRVKFSGVETDGHAFLALEKEARLQLCKGNKVLLVSENQAEQKEFLRLAIHAQLFNKKVSIQPRHCFRGNPAVTTANELKIEN